LGLPACFDDGRRWSSCSSPRGGLNLLHAAYAPSLLARFPENPLFTYAELAVGGSPAWYPRFFTYFLAGSVFFLYREAIALTLPRAIVAASALCLALFFYRGYNVVMPVAGTYLAFWFAFNREIPVSGAGRYGDFSYGLYVYGWPVQQTVIWLFNGRIAPLPLFVLSLAGALAFGVLSWMVVERPFMKLKVRAASRLRSTSFPAVLGVTIPARPEQ
jgi:peptidoglycan/LPS O-acetylase OafA/YrhL